MTSAAAHVREHHSLLAAGEKRLLVWMAHRLPGRVNSDHLTLLALIAMGLAGGAFAAARWYPPALWGVVGALALNWFGDSLDGTLARVRRAERPRYGFYVDHVLDIAGTTLLMGGLAVSGYMSPWVALMCLAAYLLVTAEIFLTTAVRGVFKMSFLWFGPTELRIVLAIGAVALLGNPQVALGAWGGHPLFDVGGAVAAFGLFTVFCWTAAKNTVLLFRLEPLGPAKAGHYEDTEARGGRLQPAR